MGEGGLIFVGDKLSVLGQKWELSGKCARAEQVARQVEVIVDEKAAAIAADIAKKYKTLDSKAVSGVRHVEDVFTQKIEKHAPFVQTLSLPSPRQAAEEFERVACKKAAAVSKAAKALKMKSGEFAPTSGGVRRSLHAAHRTVKSKALHKSLKYAGGKMKSVFSFRSSSNAGDVLV